MNFNDLYTIEFWLYARPSSVFILSDNNTDTIYNLPYMEFRVETEGAIFIDTITQPQNPPLQNYITNVELDQWCHIAIILIDKDFGMFLVFVNGTIRNTGPFTVSFQAPPIIFDNAYFEIYSDQTYLMYNFQLIQGRKYMANFTPSTDLPVADIDFYALVLYVEGKNGSREQLALAMKGTLKSFVVGTATTTISTQIPPGAVVPLSTICFVAGTPVLTDQDGYVAIEDLIPGTHTLKSKAIRVVTKSITPEKHLALIKSGALAEGIPSADTIMTLNHRVQYNGEMIKSYDLQKLNPQGITFIEYECQTLYNVLLDGCESGLMTVNNMVVETLDPGNMVGKLYLSLQGASSEKIVEITNAINEYVLNTVGNEK